VTDERATERANLTDPAVMRALAHPARLAILEHLSANEAGATATECAEVVGLSPSATSYHLRALARAGMIVEGDSRGDGRERVWRRRYAYFSVHSEKDSPPEDWAAETAMMEAVLAHQNDKIRQYLAARDDESPEWYDATSINSQSVYLTAKELTELMTRIEELVQPFSRAERPEPPDGARRVMLQLRAVPLLSKDVK
jgi:DNA-binding transcriptional ArsR family regulator